MHKIKIVSQCFVIVLQLLAFVLPLSTIFIWAYGLTIKPDAHINLECLPDHLSHLIHYPLPVDLRWKGFLLSLIPLTVNLCILYLLISLFRLYAKGIIFAPQTVTILRRLGLTLLIGQLIYPCYILLLSYVLSRHHQLTLSISNSNFGLLFTSIVLLLASWIMAEANRLHEEQQLTI